MDRAFFFSPWNQFVGRWLQADASAVFPRSVPGQYPMHIGHPSEAEVVPFPEQSLVQKFSESRRFVSPWQFVFYLHSEFSECVARVGVVCHEPTWLDLSTIMTQCASSTLGSGFALFDS